jgi:hypothetical protein
MKVEIKWGQVTGYGLSDPGSNAGKDRMMRARYKNKLHLTTSDLEQ